MLHIICGNVSGSLYIYIYIIYIYIYIYIREPDSGLGRTQDYQSRWTDDDWVDPESFTQKMEQPAGRKCRAGGRSAVNRIPEETVVHIDSRWDIPRKRALSTSDGPDSTTSVVVTFRTATQIGLRK